MLNTFPKKIWAGIGASIILALVFYFSEYHPVSVPPIPAPDNSSRTVENPSMASVVKSFSRLTNTYEDKESGFSLRYPKEMSVYHEGGKGCVSEVQITINGRISGFLMKINPPPCQSTFIDPSADTLDDHKKDYASKTEGGEVRVHIFKTTDTVTFSGVKGVRQEYAITWFDEKTGIEEDFDPKIFSVRYIFQSPSSKKFYVITSENHNSQYIYTSEADLFLEVEREIIDSIQIQ